MENVKRNGNYMEAQRVTTGRAGRTGKQIHKILIIEVVGVIDPEEEKAIKYTTYGQMFLRQFEKLPVLRATWPICGTHTGLTSRRATEIKGATVTCEKCLESNRYTEE